MVVAGPLWAQIHVVACVPLLPVMASVAPGLVWVVAMLVVLAARVVSVETCVVEVVLDVVLAPF